MKYLEGEEITVEEIKAALRKGVCEVKIFPVLCGSSYRNKGVQLMLDAVVDYLPAPTDVPAIKGILDRRYRRRVANLPTTSRSQHWHSKS